MRFDVIPDRIQVASSFKANPVGTDGVPHLVESLDTVQVLEPLGQEGEIFVLVKNFGPVEDSREEVFHVAGSGEPREVGVGHGVPDEKRASALLCLVLEPLQLGPDLRNLGCSALSIEIAVFAEER